MDKISMEEVIIFLKKRKYKIIKYILFMVIFYSLKFPLLYYLNKFSDLLIINNDKWCLELFKYLLIMFLIIFLGQYILNQIIIMNTIKTKLSKKIKTLMVLNEYFSFIILFLIIIIAIILLYFTYGIESKNYENILISTISIGMSSFIFIVILNIFLCFINMFILALE